MKAEEFIKEYTRKCSNELVAVETIDGKLVAKRNYQPWLTPDQALRAVEIAREEMKEEIMTKNEEAAVVRLLRRMNEIQRQISKPTADDATDEEVRMLFKLFWKWTPTPKYDLPSKHTVEKLVGWMRGGQDRMYCYISRQDVARIIREACDERPATDRMLSVYLNKGYREMTDVELYENGKWNYQETPLVHLLFNVYCNPSMFSEDGNRKW